MGLEDLADVHPAGNAQRVEDDVDRLPIGQEGHVFFTDDLGNDTLVSVTASHLVTNADLALGGDINFHLLDDAGVHFFTAIQAISLTIALKVELIETIFKLGNDLANLDTDR